MSDLTWVVFEKAHLQRKMNPTPLGPASSALLPALHCCSLAARRGSSARQRKLKQGQHLLEVPRSSSSSSRNYNLTDKNYLRIKRKKIGAENRTGEEKGNIKR